MFEKLDPSFWIYLSVGGLAVIIITLEGTLITRRGKGEAYDWAAFWTTVRINLWRVVVEALPVGVVLGAAIPFADWMYEHRLWTVPMDTVWGWVAMFFCTEFFYYWMHRTGHRVRWYWASHQVHHSGNQYNLAAAFRQSITGKLTGSFIFFAPQCFLGFPPMAVLLSFVFNLIYQFWIHTDLIGKLGWMEGVLNTPSAHRVHHAANVEYLDCNYGGTIMLFDRIFGTYVPEKDDVPIRYGLVKPQRSNSAIKICMAEFWAILKDLRKVRRPSHFLGYVFGPPGWAPDGKGLTTEQLRAHMVTLHGKPEGVPPEWLIDGQPQPEVAKTQAGHSAFSSASPSPAP